MISVNPSYRPGLSGDAPRSIGIVRPIPQAPGRIVLYLLLVLILLQLAVALLTFGYTLSFDEASWHYVGRNWFRLGLTPYKGGFDNKSPLIFIVYGISDLLFGVNYWFPRVVGTLVQTAGVWFLYRIAADLAGRRAGILTISLYGLSLLWDGTRGKFPSLTETYEVTALIIAAWYFINARAAKGLFISGIFAGLAFAFRLTAVSGILALFIFSFLEDRNYAIAFAGGLIVCLAVLAGAFTLAGIHLREFWSYTFADNMAGGGYSFRDAESKLNNLVNGFFHTELILFYPFLFGYLFMQRRLDWITLWLLGGCACIVRIGQYEAAHFKDILPALSLTSALCIDHLVSKYGLSFRKCLAVVWICFFPKSTEPVLCIRRIFYPVEATPQANCNPPYSPLDNLSRKKLGRWVRDHTDPGDKVLVPFYGAAIQVYTERLSPTFYFNTNEWPQAKTVFYRELREHKPGMVIIPLSEDYRQIVSGEMRSFIQGLVDTGGYRNDTCMYGYTVYRIQKRRT